MITDRPKTKVVVICGPTGVGKTTAAIKAAKIFNGEIIGADSMQIYRHMDIGTAKPSPQEQSMVPHHMIDVVDPDENFNAEQFARLAGAQVLKLHSRGITPFVVGGTGLYIKALIHGLFQSLPSDPEIRLQLKELSNTRGTPFLHSRLSECDLQAAERIHVNDTFRIIRALEIYETTGKPISEFQREHGFAVEKFEALKIGLHAERDILYDRINRRVDAMIAAGFRNEVERLLGMGFSPHLKAMQAIGYRHMTDFLQGRLDWDEMLRTLKRDTRRYAKRQMTWFKADSSIYWTEPAKLAESHPLIQKHLIRASDV
jgi:tRNA dimethylallyltransferase